MNVLLTNDDGINHPGLKKLAQELKQKHRVIIIAPENQRSACSHNITIHSPIRFKKLGEDIYSSDGYPADCVKFAVKGFINDKIDFVISGINEGPNMGIDVFYSGTVAAAREGLINQIPSMAFSLNCWGESCNFDYAAEKACEIIDIFKEKYYNNNEMFNVNFPSNNGYKGIKMTKLGTRVYKEVVINRKDPMGKEYYWLGGDFPDYEPAKDTDFMAVEEGFISITPLGLNLTDLETYEKLRGDFD